MHMLKWILQGLNQERACKRKRVAPVRKKNQGLSEREIKESRQYRDEHACIRPETGTIRPLKGNIFMELERG